MNDLMILRITLRSAATFGRGDGLAGLVDREIEHDENGIPYLRGRTLKGLLAEEAEGLVFLLNKERWRKCKERLFGVGGSSLAGRGIFHVGNAMPPAGLRARLLKAIEMNEFKPDEIFAAFTGIRRQTALNERGAPKKDTLRSMRVLVCGAILESEITFSAPPSDDDLAMLSASVLALRHAGSGRNRGRGWLSAELGNAEQTQRYFAYFKREVGA